MDRFSYQIGIGEDEERLDKWLSGAIPTLSRSYIQKCIKEGQVLVNDSPCKANYRLRVDDEVAFQIPEAVEPSVEAENIPLSVLYEDEDVLVVDKPKGMVVHPAPGHYSGTLVNAVLYHCKGQLSGINGVLRPGIVHRIDRDTTGSLIVCKNDLSHREIAGQLGAHSLNRSYRAIVHGMIKEEEGTVCAPIGRDEKDRKRMAVNEKNGKEAVTHYRVLQRFRDFTYIECRLETGRTHQIRVHMTSIGHPLLGDEIYGPRKTAFRLEGQTLHAYCLGFIHPVNREYIEVKAPLPAYFSHLLTVL
ncbi:MAG: RluA family pseudouridine synthase [Lachnospiraceae bacterium]|jgi:23S rRNA pseudouridine1911/1915/1917 synthase|nr:RluA family pseudouridine synthase [Lachnospiraceae bacterium]